MSTKSTSTRRFAVSSIASGSIVAAVIRQVQIFSDATYVTLLNETTVNNAGGYIQIIGIGFQPGCVVYFNNVLLSSTFISSTVVRATTLAVGNGSYVLLVANSLGTSNNASAIYVLTTSGFPTWSTTAYYSASVTVSVQLVATGDAPLTYSLQSGSSLPDGTTLSSSGLLSGTIIGATNGIVYSFVALVDDVDLQTTQATISLTIAFSDAYYKNVTLLLNGETAVTPFIQDASTNNFNSTINGDTKPTLFIPYQAGYYSNYFDGNLDYLTIPDNAAFGFGTGDFTIECWAYLTGSGAVNGYTLLDFRNGVTAVVKPNIGVSSSGVLTYYTYNATRITGSTLAINTWYHIALSRASGSTKLFVNGSQVGSTYTDSTDYGSTSRPVIGNVGDAPSSYNASWLGYISNFRVVKGIAVYTSAFTPGPTSILAITQSANVNGNPSAAITGSATSLLTSQSNRLIDNSLNNFTITKNGDVTVSPFIPFSSPTSVTVNNLYSTFFDGSGDYLYAPSNAVFAFGTGDFTIEGWFYFTGTISTYQRPWWFGDDNDTLEINGSVLRLGGANQGTLIIGGTTIVANTWYHIALVRSTGSYTLWLNGTQQGSTATNSYNSSARTFTLMATSGGSNPSTGYISNMRVVKGVAVYTGTFTPSTTQLTSTQLANVNGSPSAAITGTATSLLTCQNSTIIDNSTYVLTLIPAGDVRPINSTTPFTQTTTAVALTTLGGTYFNGSTGSLNIGPTVPANLVFGTNSFTIECWAYVTTLPGGICFMGNLNAGSTVYGVWTMYYYGSPSFKFTFFCNAPAVAYDFAYTIVTNQWMHVAMCRTGGNIRAFVNGVQIGATQASVVNITTSGEQSGGFYIGRTSDGLNYLPGYLSAVRIINGTGLYTSNFAPPAQPLTAVTNTSLLTLQYNGGANNSGIIDNSSFNNILTRFGNTSQGTFTPFSQTGWSTFIGYGAYGYQTLPANTGYDITGADFTVELWINFMTWNTMGSSGMTIFSSFTSGNGWGFGWGGGVGADFSFSTYVSGTYGPAITATGIRAGTDFQLGTWNHFTIMQKTSVIYFYLNGVMRYSTAAVAGVGAGSGVSLGVYQQNFTYAGNPYYYYSNFRIIKGTGIYSTAGFTPPTTPLTPIAGTTLLLGQSSNLVDNSGINATITNTSSGTTPSSQALSPFGSILPATPLSYSNYFNSTGPNSYLSIADNVNLEFGSVSMTAECWFYLIGTQAYLLDKNNSNVSGGFCLTVSTTGISWYIDASANTFVIPTTSTVITQNAWHHIALVRSVSGTTTNSIYFDGTRVGTSSVATAFPDTANNFRIGATFLNSSSYNAMTGSVSNVRIVKGSAVYDPSLTTITVPTAPLTAITNTQLLTCQSTAIIDNSANAFTITVTEVVVPRNFNPFGYTDQTNSSYSPSTVGGSIYFDGTGDYLSIPSNSPFNRLYSTTVPFTIEFWMYATGAPSPGSATILTGSSTGNTTVGFRIEWQTNNLMYWYSEPNTYPAVSQAVQLNQWGHYAFVWDGTNITTYLNGGSKKTAASSWTNIASTNVTYIATLLPGTYNYVVQGYLSNLRLVVGARVYTNPFITPTSPLTNYSAVPGSTSLLLNSTSGGIIDYHSSNVLETVGNAQLSTNIKKFGNASMYFDGSASYLSYPSTTYIFGTEDFTLEGWIYLSNITTNQTKAIFHGTTTNSLGFRVGQSYNNNVQALGIYKTGIADMDYALFTFVINTWYHVAVTRQGSTIRFFVNGIQGTTQGTPVGAFSFAAAAAVRVGFGGAVEAFSGYMDDMRVTKGFARYTANFNTSPPISPATTFLTQ